MLLTERYAPQIRGVLSCWDRVLLMGTLPDFGHAQAATRYLNQHHIRIFDFPPFAQGLRDQIRANAERLAREAGLEIEFVRSSAAVRKEERIQEVLARRGTHPGLVHILSAMEKCSTYEPWHNKATGQTYLRGDSGKCLHYYFYFLDALLGLCYLRVPTWAPYRLQFYFNGHNWLAAKLKEHGLAFTLVDNVFLDLADFGAAQKLAHDFSVQSLHHRLDHWARTFCPALAHFPAGYHWSLMQLEYATDLVFQRPADLAPLYQALVRTAVHAVQVEQVASFLGKKLSPLYQGELGSDLRTHFHTRLQGTRVRHHMGPAALKMYDKLGQVLRIETTTDDVSFFAHHRRVEHRDGTSQTKLAPVRKTIYSLPVLRTLLEAANRRYLEFLSTLDDPGSGPRDLERLSRPQREQGRSYRGFNPVAGEDLTLFLTLARGEFNIRGFQSKDLARHLPHLSGAQRSRLLKRLRTHGLLKKVGHRYRYYLTRLGRRLVAAALKLRAFVLLPALAEPRPA
jgi:hypothetical protein